MLIVLIPPSGAHSTDPKWLKMTTETEKRLEQCNSSMLHVVRGLPDVEQWQIEVQLALEKKAAAPERVSATARK